VAAPLIEFLTQLKSLGIELKEKDGRLSCVAPKGALTPELRERLGAFKEEILAHLHQMKQNRGMSQVLPPLEPAPRDDFLPLSYAQQRWRLLDLLMPGTTINNLPGCWQLSGTFHLDAFRHTFNMIVARHETLRTSIRMKGNDPIQFVEPVLDVDLPFFDLSEQPEEAQRETLEQMFSEAKNKPIDLETAPMFRTFLARLAPEEHVFFLMPHHIVWDGWSWDVFLEEINVIYPALVRGEKPAIEALSVQYGDFALWQKTVMEGGELERQAAYWRETLSGHLAVLDMPTDHPRPPQLTYGGARQDLQISKDTTDALIELGHREGATLQMVLLSVIKVLLHRYTGQEDILVGAPIQARVRPELEKLIGVFVNTVVLRTQVQPGSNFLQVLKQVKEASLGAFSHQDLPFDRVVEEINPPRDSSRTPLYQVLFSYQDVNNRGTVLGDLKRSQIHVDTTVAPTDMTFWLMEYGTGMQGAIDYNLDLFEADTMARIADHFYMLLKSALDNPHKPISQLPMLSTEEHGQLNNWNSTDVPLPSVFGLHQLFEQQAEKTPDETAVIFGSDSFTYGELNKRANKVAHHLVSLGTRPDTLVGIFVERSVDMVVGLLGILKSGSAYMPLDPLYPQDRLSYMLSDSGATLLVTQSHLLDRKPVDDIQTICLDGDWPVIDQLSAENPDMPGDPEHMAYAIYTSGSTGKPKGVLIPHRAAINFLCSMAKAPGFTAEDTILAVTTLSFDIAVLELFLPLCVGGGCHIVSGDIAADGRQLADALIYSGATVLQATPITYRMLLEAGWKGDKNLKILCGGEALTRDLSDQLLSRCGALWNMYGPTETTVWSAIHQVHAEEQIILIGNPIDNTKIHILDTNFQPAPVGGTGELYIGGDGLARGYHNRPELTDERFVTDPFDAERRLYRTGDLARWRPDGTIECLGRVDFQVKVRGHRIELGEIESALSNYEHIAQAVVIAREDSPGDKRLVGYYTATDGAEIAAGDLRHLLRESLPEYMVPSAFANLEAFPQTPNGKVDRKALPAPDRTDHETDREIIGARDTLEAQLVTIWQEVLHVNPIGVQDNFFDIGGHSLLAVRVFNEISNATGKTLPLATLFQAPTIEQLAAIIREDEDLTVTSALVTIQPNGTKPPYFCVHGHFGNILLFADLARNLGEDQPFYALQSIGLPKGQTPLTRVEEMAAVYIEEMRTVQPQGPYHFGGLCFGGLIALEMAHQLRDQGEQVGFVTMLDMFPSVLPALMPASVVKRYIQYANNHRIEFHSSQLRERGVTEKVSYLTSGLADKVKEKVQGVALIAAEAISEKLGRDLPESFQNVDWANTLAFRSYKPRAYEGDLSLFLSKEMTDGYSDDPQKDWSGVAEGKVDVYLMEDEGITGHKAGEGMFREPYVQALAEQLAACFCKKQTDSHKIS
jgi:amino acid adenylation domain-containing protein